MKLETINEHYIDRSSLWAYQLTGEFVDKKVPKLDDSGLYNEDLEKKRQFSFQS